MQSYPIHMQYCNGQQMLFLASYVIFSLISESAAHFGWYVAELVEDEIADRFSDGRPLEGWLTERPLNHRMVLSLQQLPKFIYTTK